MWLGRNGEIPFGRLPKILQKMQKTFPRLCHSLLQGIQQRNLRPSSGEDIPPVGLDGTGVGALGARASPQGLAPSPHYGLPNTNDSGCLNPEPLPDASIASKPGSIVGGALGRQLSSPGFDPCLEHSSSILQNLDSWPLSQSSVSLPPVPQGSGPLRQGTGGYGALGACASPQELTPSTHSDLSYSNNSTCPNPDLLLDDLLVTNPGGTMG